MVTHSLVLDVPVNKLLLAVGCWLLAVGCWLLAVGCLFSLQTSKVGTHFNYALASAICKVLHVKTAIQMSASLCEVS